MWRKMLDDMINIPLTNNEVLGRTPKNQHVHISTDRRHKVDIDEWAESHKDDPAALVRLCEQR